MKKSLLFYVVICIIFTQSGQAMWSNKLSTQNQFLSEEKTSTLMTNPMQGMKEDMEFGTPQERGKKLEEAMKKEKELNKTSKAGLRILLKMEKKYDKNQNFKDLELEKKYIKIQSLNLLFENNKKDQEISALYEKRKKSFSKKTQDYVDKKLQDLEEYQKEMSDKIKILSAKITWKDGVDSFFKTLDAFSEDMETKKEEEYCLKLGIQRDPQGWIDDKEHIEYKTSQPVEDNTEMTTKGKKISDMEEEKK